MVVHFYFAFLGTLFIAIEKMMVFKEMDTLCDPFITHSKVP